MVRSCVNLHESRRKAAAKKESQVGTEEKVIAIVSEQLSVPKEEIARESKFVDDLKADFNRALKIARKVAGDRA